MKISTIFEEIMLNIMESTLNQEQKDKLSTLRYEADKELVEAVKNAKNRLNPKTPPIKTYNVGDKITITNSEENGTITKILENNQYEITTTTKKVVIKSHKSLKSRVVIDYSNIIIPEELKKISDDRLLDTLKRCRFKGHPKFTLDEIKAELLKRGHIKRKSEKIEDKKQDKINKLKAIVKKQKKAGKTDTKQIQELKRLLN